MPGDADEDIQATTSAVSTQKAGSKTPAATSISAEQQSLSLPAGSPSVRTGFGSGSAGSRSSLNSAAEESPDSGSPSSGVPQYGARNAAARAARQRATSAPSGPHGVAQKRRASEGAPRHDVSEPGGRGDIAASAMRRGLHLVQPPKQARDALGGRVAEIRKLHARVLAATGEFDNDEEEDGGGVGESMTSLPPAPCIFDREDGAKHISLSAYTAARPDEEEVPLDLKPHDELDVLAGVSDLWKKKQGIQDPNDHGHFAGTLGEIRFQQMQEVQAVKRVFARSGVPVDVGLLERALVIPHHRVEDAEAKYHEALRCTYVQAKKAPKKKKPKSRSGSSQGKGNKKAKAAAGPAGDKKAAKAPAGARSKSPKPAKGGKSKDKSKARKG